MDNIDSTNIRIAETIAVSNAFRTAEAGLKAQVDRLGKSDRKWALVKHLAPRFEKLAARIDVLQVLVDRAFQREHAIEEIKSMTAEKLALAVEVKRVMDEHDALETTKS